MRRKRCGLDPARVFIMSGETNQSSIRKRLLVLRAELVASAVANEQSSQVVELDQSKVGRLSRMDALQAQAMSQASGRRAEAMLRSIDAAIKRVDDDEYGDCKSCGEPIADKRLEFDPAALLCIACAEEAEDEFR